MSLKRKLVITIDGPAGVGKSTVARLLATRLKLVYLDTGATYRALAYQALLRGVDPRDEARLLPLAACLRLVLRQSASGSVKVLLDGRDVTRKIRTERVTDAAAMVAQHPRVRAALVRLQRKLAAHADRVIAEGRDTGTVVFPQATYKFFLTAKNNVRARRRQKELRAVQGYSPSLVLISGQLKSRDQLDRHRLVGPLIKPSGAIVLDTTHLLASQVVQRMLRRLPPRQRQTGVNAHSRLH